MYGHRYSKSKDQPGKVANPSRGQLNRKNDQPGKVANPARCQLKRENEYFPVLVRA